MQSPDPMAPRAAPAPKNTTFVIKNSTGLPNHEVYVKFLAAHVDDGIVHTATPQTYGPGHALPCGADTKKRSFSLAELEGVVNRGVTRYGQTPMPTFSLNSFGAVGRGAGRVYFSLKHPLRSEDGGGPPFLPASVSPDVGVTFGFVEGEVHGSGRDSNLDVSYVDFVGVPICAGVYQKNGEPLPISNGTPAQSSHRLIPTLLQAVPKDAVVPTGTPGGVARVLSSVHASGYHTWSRLLGRLREARTSLPVGSYEPPADSPMAGKSFWYVGQAGRSNTTPELPPHFMNAALYRFTATCVADLNPTADPALPIPHHTPGVHLTGTATAPPHAKHEVPSGTIDIYITEEELDAPTGIYGSNPDYVIVHKKVAYQANNGISYDLTGRVVGSFCAGIVFGWAGNATGLAAHARATGTTLPSGFDELTIGALPVEKYLALLSMQATPQALSAWLGAQITDAPSACDAYASAGISSGCNPYFTGFQDRLQGNQEPIFFWPVSDAPPGYTDIGDGYVLIELLR